MVWECMPSSMVVLDCSVLHGCYFLNLLIAILEALHVFLKAVINVKPLDSVLGIHRDLSISVKLDDASLHHVVKLLGRSNVFRSFLLSSLDSASQVRQLRHVLLELLLLHDLLLLLLLDLVLGSSSLGAHLEHVGADALVHYSKNKVRDRNGAAHLHETDEEA